MNPLFGFENFKVTDLFNTVGAPIGVIIAGTIFLQFLSSKYVGLFSTFAQLTKEYREHQRTAPRHTPLVTQISIYRRRLWLLCWASWMAACALLTLILPIIAGLLSLAFPEILALKKIGLYFLVAGMCLIGGGVALEFWESVVARHEIREEMADLDEEAKKCAC
jgi:hypothetical protein